MTKYKLFRFLNILTGTEAKEIEKQLSEPKQKDMLRLFRSAKKLMQKKKETPNAKEVLSSQMFPGLPYDDGRMRKLMTRLTHILKNYLTEKELSGNDAMKKGSLAKSLYYRNDYKLFMEAAEGRLKELDMQKKRGLSYFREKYQLLQSIYFHPESAKFTTKNNYFHEAAFYQERYFVLGALLTGAESLSRNRAIKSLDGFVFLGPAIKAVNEMGDDCPIVISLFNDLVRLLQKQDEKPDLVKLKNRLFSSFEIMELDEQRMALKLLIVYATPFSNRGEKEFTRFIFDLYRLGIEHQLHRHGNSPFGTILFLNIAITGAKVDELEWTKHFIIKHNRELPQEDQAPALNLSWAAWHYKKGLSENNIGELKEALSLLNLIPTRSEEIFDLRTRSLYLRIIFDLFITGQITFDTVRENARNFEKHLQGNNTYSISKKETYLAFTSYCRQLAKLHNEPRKNKKGIKSFMTALLSDESCVLKHWLLEKAEEVLPSSAYWN